MNDIENFSAASEDKTQLIVDTQELEALIKTAMYADIDFDEEFDVVRSVN